MPDDALTPKTYGQALRHPDADQWKRAIGEELASLYQDRQCWEYVVYPRNGTLLLNIHFVFKTKMRDGEVIKRKARLVVGGHRQEEGVDYNEIFASVMKYTTLCMFCAVACVNSMLIHQLDFERVLCCCLGLTTPEQPR